MSSFPRWILKELHNFPVAVSERVTDLRVGRGFNTWCEPVPFPSNRNTHVLSIYRPGDIFGDFFDGGAKSGDALMVVGALTADISTLNCFS